MSDLIFGLSWGDIQRAQRKESFRRPINTSQDGDHGADPVGDGTFKMIPSGDIVDSAERNRRLSARA